MMLENRSAPTSLLLSMKEPASHLTERSLSDMASIKSANPSQQQLAANSSNGVSWPDGSELINSKFNELAKKILEELSQSQYSKEFFHALDCIIKEPTTKHLMARTRLPATRKGHNQSAQNGSSSDRKRINRRRIKVSDNSQNSSTSELTLSSSTTNNTTKQKLVSKYQAPAGTQIPQPEKSRHNAITRSHTITSIRGVAAHLEKLAQERTGQTKSTVTGSSRANREPRQTVFNRKDIGSLYKPNMNYSTSVLGNHRLSDDDEIIIIPTQSPSLMSTSPDGNDADEASERFSISRTKSFWEKLSKGNNNHATLANEEGSDSLIVSHNNNSTSNNNNNNHNHNRSSTASASAGHNHYDKPMPVRGQNPNFLDRMDSTGGSNSNYNGSSSGDENFTSYTNPNPTIRHLQEMNRQNRLRQTR